MVHCPKCGTQVPGSFCPSCGAQVVAPGQQQAAAAMVPPPPPQGQQAPPAYPAAPPQPPHQPYAPPAQPYGAPAQQPYGAQPQQPYGAPAQQPYGAPGYAPPVPVRKGGAGKVLLIILGVVVGLFVLLVVIGSMLPDTGVVSGPTITDRVDPDSQAPQTSSKTSLPPSTDLIYAAVEVNLSAGQVVTARWSFDGVRQPQLDTRLPVDSDYEGWASFNISNGGEPWLKGTWLFELFIDGEKAAEKSFSIK